MKKLKSILMLLILSLNLTLSTISEYGINPCSAEPPFNITEEFTGQ